MRFVQRAAFAVAILMAGAAEAKPPAPVAPPATAALGSVSREDWKQTTLPARCDTEWWQRAVQGRVNKRRCAIAQLEYLRSSPSATHDQVALAARVLAEAYRERSGRQQAFVDVGAGASGLTALGYAAIGDAAGAMTQSVWGYSALAPVLLVQFNANEPTRDLYFAGQIATGLLAERYAAMDQRLTLLGKTTSPDTLSRCAQAEAELASLATWPDVAARTELRPLVQEVLQRCRDFSLAASQVDSIEDLALGWREQWARAYAADVLQLEARLVERDSRLRTTPSGALKMMVSTPLRQLDSLVSGESVQAAIDTVRVLTALDGLGFSLASFDLPVPPQPMATPFVTPASLQARLADAAATAPNCRGSTCRYDAGRTARWLHAALTDLEVARQRQNLRTQWATATHQAAQTVDLTFAYNTGSNRIDVMLRGPQGLGATTAPGAPGAAP